MVPVSVIFLPYIENDITISTVLIMLIIIIIIIVSLTNNIIVKFVFCLCKLLFLIQLYLEAENKRAFAWRVCWDNTNTQHLPGTTNVQNNGQITCLNRNTAK